MLVIVRHFYFQRRRLTLSGLLAFLAGYILNSHVEATTMGIPFSVFAGLIYLAAVVLAAAFSSYFFPNLRRLIDGIAVARLVFALWVVGTGSYGLAASPMASATIIVGSAIILSRIGAWVENPRLTPPAGEAHLNVVAGMNAFLSWLDNTAEYEGRNGEMLIRANASQPFGTRPFA